MKNLKYLTGHSQEIRLPLHNHCNAIPTIRRALEAMDLDD
jgi:hypothetical protein